MVSQRISLLVFSLLLPLLPAFADDLAADKTALLLLRAAVGGRTRRWNISDPTPCLWEGVTCDKSTRRVTALRLPGKGISGKIPDDSIGSLTQLRNLSLRQNALSGPLPSDLGSCMELRYIYLQGNQFSSKIPAGFFGLRNLLRLNLAGNKFSGDLSPALNDLTQLRTLYLQNNQFVGSLPELSNLSFLREFNVSNNKLNGSIPSNLDKFSSSSFLGNSLCGSPLNPCPAAKGSKLSGGAIAGIVIGSVLGLILVLLVSLIIWRKTSNIQILRPMEMSPAPASPVKAQENHVQRPVPVTENWGSGNGLEVTIRPGEDGLVFFGDRIVFSLEELLKASAEVLGKGGFGTTYRAYLEGGAQVVVVKRLKNVCVTEADFRDKVEWLGKMAVHKNLVPLRAYYYGRDEKLLVYDSMPSGSLAAFLHGYTRSRKMSSFNWEVRRRIALGVATSIEYLHSLGPSFCHGSIKSSNIFLTDNHRACLSEYGITELVSSPPNLLGYRAPEVVDTKHVSQKADVYAFGVLLLELLTGKSPTDALTEEGIDLPRWVQSVVQEKWTIDVFDPELVKNQQQNEEQMVQLLHLAIHCSSLHPERRLAMGEVTRRIREICAGRRGQEE